MTAPIGVTREEVQQWCGDDLDLIHVGNITWSGGMQRLILEAVNWRTLWTLLDRIELDLDPGHGDVLIKRVIIGQHGPAWRATFPYAVLDEN